MSDNTGITTAVLAGANRPGKRDESMAQDELARKQGYEGLPNCPVEYVAPGREAVRDLPSTPEVSPLSRPRHGAGKGNVSTLSQRPARGR